MSSISSIGGGNQSLYQFLQSLSGTTQSQSASATSSASGASSDPTQTLGQVLQSGHRHHHHGGGAAFKQIQDAVTSALQSAQSSGNTSDPNKIVEDAIAQVLKNNNGSASTSASSTTLAATGTDPDGDSAAAGTTAAKTAQQSFFSTLQSLGISPKQFQQDFLAAVKDAQGGQVNLATAFQSMPVGATVDTIG